MKKKLPDDPREALLAIAEYINQMKTTAENRIPAGGDPRASLGYWHSHEYLHGLLGLACEAERVAKGKQ